MKKIIVTLSIIFSSIFLFACANNTNNANTPIVTDKQYEIYEAAKESGYTGTYEEWLDSIKGDEIELSTNATHIVWRYVGESKWKELIKIETLQGSNGTNGKSAYEIAVELGYKGSKEEWLNSLIGNDGADGREIELSTNATHIVWRYVGESKWKELIKIETLQGSNGKSAYETYLESHPEYKGSEQQWINDLVSGKLEAINNSKDVDYIPDVSLLVSKGQIINLPKTVTVYLRNGSYDTCEVEWLHTNEINSNFLGYKKISGFVKKYNYKVNCYVRVMPYATNDLVIDGYVNGLLGEDTALVTLYNNDNFLETKEVYGNGYYTFNNLKAGEYFLKVEAKGYYISKILKVTVSNIKPDVETKYSNVSHNNFDLVLIRDDSYYFGWEKDQNNNNETQSNVVINHDVTFIENKEMINDLGKASELREKYNVYLVDDKLKWSIESISRFYDLYHTIPLDVTKNLNSVWTLVNYSIKNDITFELRDGVYYVTLSKEAIENSTPRVAIINNEKGKYFSKRLYHAIVRFVTDNGKNADACETILKTNFLTSFNVPDYTKLTAGITNEDASQFQEFLPEEKILILTMFEEMPEGMHKMKELKYLVRRKTGQSHPIYPSAAAVTWTTANEPYIEFMDSTFGSEQGYYHTKRLIIHEKTHMFWEYYFSAELKKEWCNIGGWYENPDDPDGWSTTKQTEFVSAYAHTHNPDEDMAESVATYVINPKLLQSRSINKYNFIKNYIMNGSVYLTQIREDLTFEVYNLNPDYTYPGQIKKIEVKVIGDQFEDKTVKFRIELFGSDSFSGASWMKFRIHPIDKNSTQEYDVQMSPANSNGTILEGSLIVSKYSYSGYWFTDQIRIGDSVGNERYESNTDFSMKIFIDNPLYDNIAPELVRNTLKLSLENANNIDHPTAQNLVVEFDYKENIKIRRVLVRLYCKSSTKSDSIDIYAKYDEIDHINQKIKMKIYIPEHYPSGIYEISEISFWDVAENNNFYHVNYGTLVNENNTIEIINSNPDYVGPTLDINNIKISAVPSNPEAPNGETFVTLKLRIQDNVSGLKIGYLRLLDPEGKQHGYWLYPPKYGNGSFYFDGDPTIEQEYIFKVTLPKGSAPGTWGIYEISLTDFALNSIVYDFTETIHFEITK